MYKTYIVSVMFRRWNREAMQIKVYTYIENRIDEVIRKVMEEHAKDCLDPKKYYVKSINVEAQY